MVDTKVRTRGDTTREGGQEEFLSGCLDGQRFPVSGKDETRQ